MKNPLSNIRQFCAYLSFMLVVSALLSACGGGGGGSGASAPVPTPPPLTEARTDGNRTPQAVVLSPLSAADTVDYNTAEYRGNWGLNAINAAPAYNHGYFGQGVTVAVLDTGIQATHENLGANVVPGGRVGFDENRNVIIITQGHGYADENGHGTGVAGIIAGVMNGSVVHGVAPQAKVMPVQIFDKDGSRITSYGEGSLREKTEVNGIAFALNRNVPIINNSYGITREITIRYVDDDNADNPHPITAVIPDFPVIPEVLSVISNADLAEYRSFIEMSLISDEIADNDAVMVWSAGNGGWNSKGGVTRVKINTGEASSSDSDETSESTRFLMENADILVGDNAYSMSDLSLALDQPQILALAPLYYPDLLGKWVVAVATEENNDITYFSQGCGKAKFWCLAAPGDDITIATANNKYEERSGTSLSAPHVSGALAVLRSRFPAMPMSAVLAILFEAADDYGDDGVDEVYGQGLLNLGKAITMQGAMALPVPGGDTTAAGVDSPAGGSGAGSSGRQVMGFSDTQFAVGAGALARQLAGLSVAVGYLGGAYYFDVPLSKVSDFKMGEEISLGNAAADMFGSSHRAGGHIGAMAMIDAHSGQLRRAGYAGEDWHVAYDICTDCPSASWRIDEPARAGDGISSAHFGKNQQGMGAAWSAGAFGVDELELFSAMGLGEDGEEESYRQYGLRWQDTLSPSSPLSFMAELSEIQEEDALLGNRGDVFGFTASKSRQARLELSGEVGGWQWQGGYLHGRTDTGVDGTGLVTEVSDIRYNQWHIEGLAKSLLQGEDEFRFGVTGLPQVRGLVKIDYYRASNEKFVDDFQFSLPTGLTAQSLTMRELSDKTMVWCMGYKWRPFDIRGMQAAVGMERAFGGVSDGDTSASFQLRWDF